MENLCDRYVGYIFKDDFFDIENLIYLISMDGDFFYGKINNTDITCFYEKLNENNQNDNKKIFADLLSFKWNAKGDISGNEQNMNDKITSHIETIITTITNEKSQIDEIKKSLENKNIFECFEILYEYQEGVFQKSKYFIDLNDCVSKKDNSPYIGYSSIDDDNHRISLLMNVSKNNDELEICSVHDFKNDKWEYLNEMILNDENSKEFNEKLSYFYEVNSQKLCKMSFFENKDEEISVDKIKNNDKIKINCLRKTLLNLWYLYLFSLKTEKYIKYEFICNGHEILQGEGNQTDEQNKEKKENNEKKIKSILEFKIQLEQNIKNFFLNGDDDSFDENKMYDLVIEYFDIHKIFQLFNVEKNKMLKEIIQQSKQLYKMLYSIIRIPLFYEESIIDEMLKINTNQEKHKGGKKTNKTNKTNKKYSVIINGKYNRTIKKS